MALLQLRQIREKKIATAAIGILSLLPTFIHVYLVTLGGCEAYCAAFSCATLGTTGFLFAVSMILIFALSRLWTHALLAAVALLISLAANFRVFVYG
jgi:hypothetical protein